MKYFRYSISLPLSGLFFLFMVVAFTLEITAQDSPLTAYRDGQIFTFYEKNPHGLIFQDSQGFLWGDYMNKRLIRFDGKQTKVFVNDPNDSTSVYCTSEVNFLFQDRDGKIWISLNDCGLERFDPKTEQFEHFSEKFHAADGFIPGYFYNIFEDREGNILAGTQGGLYVFSRANGFFSKIGKHTDARPLFEDDKGNLGVLYPTLERVLLQMLNQEWKPILPEIVLPDFQFPQLPDPWLPDLAFSLEYPSEGSPNIFIFQTLGNLYTYDASTNEARNITYLLDEGEWNSSLYVEDSTVLVGTTHGRLLQFHPKEERFSTFVNFPNSKEETDPIIRIFKTKDGLLWVVGQTKTFQIQPRSAIFKTKLYPKEIKRGFDNRSQTMVSFNGNMYFRVQNSMEPFFKTTGLEGLYLELPSIKDRSMEFIKFCENKQDKILWSVSRSFLTRFERDEENRMVSIPVLKNSEKLSVLQQITLDQKGQMWLAFWNQMGIINLRELSGQIIHFDPDSNLPFAREFTLNTRILVDSRNLVWVGHHAKGISCYDPETKQTHRYKHDPQDHTSISTNLRVNGMVEDAQSNIWVATANGLNKWSPKTKAFQRIFEPNPSYSERVQSLVIDNNQHIWFSTIHHLIKYEPESNNYYSFSQKDGLAISSFIDKDAYKDAAGHLFFPSSVFAEGVLYFHPDSIRLDTIVPELLFTALHIKDDPVKVGAEDGLLEQSINFTDRIIFQPDQNIFTISYGAIEYRYPDEVRYAVWLEGFHDEWQQVGDKREATFTNLDPGTYTFMVKVRNHHGFWSKTPRSLIIVILPPWYRTWWAYSLWTIMLLGTIYWIYRFQLNRRLAEAETVRLKEVNLAKSQLYTNITHEFRTPLTIILGMAEQVKSDPDNWLNEGLQLIRRNGKQLLNLINQLLDLSKLESDNMPLKMINGDFVQFTKYQIESFHSYADSKDIRIHFASDFKVLYTDYDPEKIQNILSNLLSNAIKFTDTGGDIYVDLRPVIELEDWFAIQVRDNGIGIAAEHLPHIFDRFYQVDATTTRRGEGTGIGLALTKELVKIMGGEIEVESADGLGTKFTIQLPITKKARATHPDIVLSETSQISESILESDVNKLETEPVFQYNKPVVLLVEDNKDVITYLSSFLSNQYQIVTATNGQEGIEAAYSIIPDLIVSDVMMPEKDGYDLCATLKMDERTDHIPIILLTAKSDQYSRITGLKEGADAYLSKPFNKEELIVRIEKLIALRKQLQTRFQEPGSLRKVLQTKPGEYSDPFLQKIVEIVETNLSNEDFDIHKLCKAVNMSHSNLFRKLKALTGKSISVFIRSLRLEKAKELLETTNLTVSEVAYESGFNTPKYFSKVFHEEYGISPREVRKNNL